LAALTKEVRGGSSLIDIRGLAIEVRDDVGAIFRLSFTFDVSA